MTISQKLKQFLDQERVPYEYLEHEPAYTAMEIAGAQHLPGRQFVKSVIIKADNKYLLCVLPAIHYIDLPRLQTFLKAKTLSLATEEEVARLFPDDEVGAESPFGQLYGLPVLVDKILEEDDEIAFNAGTHTELIRIKFSDFQRLARPQIVDMGVHIHTVKG